VIKVETAGGDHMRTTPPMRDGQSSYFGQLNAGKKSVVLDLKNPDDHARILSLIDSADILVENYRPGVMRRLKLDYATLVARNPKLIYCAISGFGQTGPRAHEPAYAPMVHAGSGYDLAMMDCQTEASKPPNNGIFIADVLAASHAFGAIQTGIIGQLKHGKGCFIDVALMDCMINLLLIECQFAQFPQQQKRNFYGPSQAKDGFVIITPITQKNFEEMARAMGHEEWISDPRFVTALARRDHWGELYAAMDSWTLQRSAKDCEDILVTAGVPCSRYRPIGEAIADPQTQHRGVMAEVEDSAGRFKVSMAPYRFDNAVVKPRGPAPDLGAHNQHFFGPK
jgi:crotonobetainyl-CoA:carnitine CoA-transferase CaiB-like acyl-CoA transferase